MDAIGGYFELAEFENGVGFPHSTGILLNTGRNALEFILNYIQDIKLIYLPYYTCDVVVHTLNKLRIKFSFYHINNHFEIEDLIELKEGEYIIANNYFGIKDSYIKLLASTYKNKLIIDNSQAFFAKPLKGIKSFYSCRKYVGVCDGGIAYGIKDYHISDLPEEPSLNHSEHLIIRKQIGAEAGFAAFQRDESLLDAQPIRRMSGFTKKILEHIDYNRVKVIRKTNFEYLHKKLLEYNTIDLPDSNSFECPMVYPFSLKDSSNLRDRLIKNRIYIARYWPNIVDSKHFSCEVSMAKNILAIPIDQRYGETEMDIILDNICIFNS